MSFIPSTAYENYLFSTIRIEGEFCNGTGVFFQKKVDDNQSRLFLVTNKHVILEAGSWIKLFFHSLNKDGTFEPGQRIRNYDIPTNENKNLIFESNDWIFHPQYDLAIFNISNIYNKAKSNYHDLFMHILDVDDDSNFMSLEQSNAFDACLDVAFLGYPSGIMDEFYKIPIIRRASTATPIYFDYDGKKEFLIDGGIYPGSSGSPVILHPGVGNLDKKSNSRNVGGTTAYFLGILTYVLTAGKDGELIRKHINQKALKFDDIEYLLNLGGVIKAEVIREFINYYYSKI